MAAEEQVPANENESYPRRVARDFVADQLEHLAALLRLPWRGSLLHRLVPLILFGIAALLWAGNVEQPPGFRPWLPYLGIALAGLAVLLAAPVRPDGRARRMAWSIVGATLILLVAWGRVDWWIDEQRTVDGEITRTSYWRWSHSPFYHSHRSPGKDGSSMWGPMTPSGMYHGRWQGWPPIDDAWYWYGEEISEGEWHERHNEEPIYGKAGIGDGGLTLILLFWIGAGSYLVRQFLRSRHQGPATAAAPRQ